MGIDFNKFRDIIAEQLNIHPNLIKKEAFFVDDLGADSIDTVELIMLFETKYKIKISEEEATSLLTVGDAMKAIEMKI